MGARVGSAIAVLGTGALGSPIGALLTRHGHDVILIDQWPAHVEAMKAKGLRVTVGPLDHPVERFTVAVRAYHVHELAALRPRLDIVFLTCKSYDSQWMTQLIAPYLAEDGVVISVQNSLNDEWIAPIVGRERDVACVLTAGGGQLIGPGDTWRDHVRNAYVVGELDGRMTPRLRQIADVLGAAAEVTQSPRIWGAKWTKLVKTAMAAPIAGMTARRSRELFGDPDCRRVGAALGVETIRVALALGIEMEPIVPDLTTEELIAAPDLLLGKGQPALVPGKEAPNFISQDLAKGRRTEIDYINGLVCRKGASAGVPTPLNELAVDVIHRLERADMRPDLGNVKLLADSLDHRAPGIGAAS
jgi:2-dehydropantoate 2-reductase